MYDRDVARHRADAGARTPLTSLTDLVMEHVGTLGRSGMVLAMSSGLVATMGLPAQAGGRSSAPAVASPSVGAEPAVAPQSGLMSAQAHGSAPAAALTAPAAATVAFERSSFKAVPQAKNHPAAATSNGVATVPEGATRGSAVLTIAARYLGTPYVYGGTTPAGFDCSGYTGYVYRQLGINLPRTANEQMNATTRIPRSEAEPGDLVFFVSGGRAYHNGIYAGGNMMYDSPRSGKSVSKRAIWSATVIFTRVS